LIEDKAFDSDKPDNELEQQGIELIASHRANRSKPSAQDGRALRRCRQRWKVERLFVWLRQFHRILPRHEYHAANFMDFVRLGCLTVSCASIFEMSSTHLPVAGCLMLGCGLQRVRI
jgi:hypothetical protein